MASQGDDLTVDLSDTDSDLLESEYTSDYKTPVIVPSKFANYSSDKAATSFAGAPALPPLEDLTNPEAPNAPKRLKTSRTRRIRPEDITELTDSKLPPRKILEDEDADVQKMLHDHWVSIQTFHRPNRVQSTFNVRLSHSHVKKKLDSIYQSQTGSFKINASVGSILRNRKTKKLRYFHSSLNNHRLFDQQILVTNRAQFDEFVASFMSLASICFTNSSNSASFVTVIC